MRNRWKREKPCTCADHIKDARTHEANHAYNRDTEGCPEDPRWRWVCACGSKGRWQYQSSNVAYHQWLGHVDRSRTARLEFL